MKKYNGFGLIQRALAMLTNSLVLFEIVCVSTALMLVEETTVLKIGTTQWGRMWLHVVSAIMNLDQFFRVHSQPFRWSYEELQSLEV